MIKFEKIKAVHLELSSFCNARCPLCPRNFKGYPYNDGYKETNLTLTQIQKIFDELFLQQLIKIYVNGNFGDMIMNPDAIDILNYFKSVNPLLDIKVSTNGSAKNAKFWQNLAKLATVEFCLDGLGDTHTLYRQNTNWNTIIKNAKTFINAGGIAVWKFIKFEHNKHQIDDCKKLASALNFSSFKLIDHGRNTGPVYNKQGRLVHVMGNYFGETSFPVLFHKKKTDLVLLEDLNKEPKRKISCKTKMSNEIYISSTGEVYPCCFLGFSPRTYGHGEYHQAVNAQVKNILPESNNALHMPLKNCIDWFTEVEKSWNNCSYDSGRLVICDDNCGSN